MYILGMMSNVIYFNIFTIKRDGQASLVCAVLGGQVGEDLGGKVLGAVGQEGLRATSVRRRISLVSKGEKMKGKVMEEGQAT